MSPKKPRKPRERSPHVHAKRRQQANQRLKRFLIEPLESRELLAADLNYSPIPAVNDLTLVANASPLSLSLVQTGTATTVATVLLDDAGDVQVNVRRTTLADGVGDTLRINANSLNLLNTFVASSGGTLTIQFDGGLETPISDDHVRIEGTGVHSLSYSLNVLSSCDTTLAIGTWTVNGTLTVDAEDIVSMSGGSIQATNLNLRSTPTKSGSGDGLDPTKVISLPSAAVNLNGGSLNATNITIEAIATSSVTINNASVLNGSISFGTIVVTSSATVDIIGNASIVATGALNITGRSNVTSTVSRAPQDDGNASDDDKREDAAVAVSIISSSATVHVGGSAVLSSNGAMNVLADNQVNATTTADGTAGSSNAGGTLATLVLSGDTTINVDGTASVTAGGNLSLNSTSNRTANTTAKSTSQGATEDGNAGTKTKGQQALQDNNASTSDGAVSLAASIGIATVSGDTKAEINGGSVRSTAGNMNLNSNASHNITTTADGSFTSGSSGTGVGVAVVIGTVDADSIAAIGGTTSVDGNTVTVDGRVSNGTNTLLAKSGPKGNASGADVGVAGSLAIGVQIVNARGQIKPNSSVNANGANLVLNANENTTASTQAIPFENASTGQSLGIGASVAIHVADHSTTATVEDLAAVTNANDLTLNAVSINNATTNAKAGAAGGTAIAAVVAITIANEDTVAQLGAGSLMTLTGSFSAIADHSGTNVTQANGDSAGGGTAAIGVAIAQSFIDERTEATSGRDLTVTNNMSFVATGGSSSTATAKATANGSSSGGGTADNKNATQRNSANSKASGKGARTSSGNQSTPSASSAEGSVTVAAALALNLSESIQRARIPNNRTMTAGGVTVVRSSANNDASATADAIATNASSVGVGTSVAINGVKVFNEAIVDASSNLTTDGLTVEALMRNVGGNTTHTFATNSVSGAADGNVGISTALAINLVDTQSLAEIRTGTTVSGLVGQSLTVRAQSTTDNASRAKPEGDGGVGSDVGVGGSFAMNRARNFVSALVQDSVSLNGSLTSVTVEAIGNHIATTEAVNGGGGSIGVGAAVAVAIIDNDSHARLGTGNSLTASSFATILTNHTSRTTTRGDATAAASSVGVGAMVGINDISDDSSAVLARSMNLTGNLTVQSLATVASTIETKASAKGNRNNADNADAEALKQRNNSPNAGSLKSLPSAASNASSANSAASSQSSTGSSSVGVAAAIAVNSLSTSNRAAIESGADVTTVGSANVIAQSHVDSNIKAVGTAVTLSESNNIGAAVSISSVTASNLGLVNTGSDVRAGGITVEANSTNNENNDFIVWAAAAGGGTGNIGIAGSVAVNVVSFTTEAANRSASSLRSSGSLTVSARNYLNPQTLAAGGGFSGGTSVGAAVAITTLTTNTQASINGAADAANAMLVRADTRMQPTRIDVPLLGNSDDPTAVSVAVAGGASSGGVGIAGAVVVNVFDMTTLGFIGASASINQDPTIVDSVGQTLTIDVDDNTNVTSFAGSLGISANSVGVGAGLDVAVITKNVRSSIGTSSLVASRSNVLLDADAIEDYTTLAVNGGAGNSVGVAGSASVYVLATSARSQIEDGVNVDSDGSVTVSATGNFDLTALAGSVGIGGSTGIGASNVTLTHNDTVLAIVGNNATVLAEGGTGLTVSASSTENIIGTSAAGAGAGTAAVAGSATVLVLDETTRAIIGRSTNIDADNGATAGTPGVSVTSNATTQIVSIAGSLAAAGTAAVGVGADVNSLKKVTEAFIDSNATVIAEADIVVTSDSSEDFTSVAAGLSASGNASVAGDAGVHVLDLTTRAFIGDDPSDAIPSAGPGNVKAISDVIIAADDRTEIDKIVGVLAVAVYAGIGAASGVSTIDKRTEAFVGAGARVTAEGGGTAATVRTGDFIVGSGSSSPSTPGIEASGSVNLNSNTASLSAQGEIGSPRVGNMDVDQKGGNDANDPSMTSQRTLVPRTRANFRGLSVTSTNRDDLEVYTISLAGGLVGVAISAGISVVEANTTAYIGNGANINADSLSPSPEQSIQVAAGHDFSQVGFGTTLSGGAIAVSPSVGVAVLSNTTDAYIGSGANLRAANDLSVEAYGSEDILVVGLGIAGGSIGLGGSVDVMTVTNSVRANIGSVAVVAVGGDVLVQATDNTDADVISGALGAGGLAGIGGSVGVINIDKTTTASIESAAVVDAKGVGTGIGGVFIGDKIGDGDGFAVSTIKGVIVQAKSLEDFNHLSVAAGAGFVGVAGGVAVTLIDSDTTASIRPNALINQAIGNPGADFQQSVYVNAANTVRGTSFAGALGGGTVGVAGAVDVGALKNDTLAEIGSGARVTARDDVEVNSLGIKDTNGFTFSGAGGLVGLSAAVSVWSIGTPLQKNYSNRDGASADATIGSGPTSADSDATAQAQNGHGQSSQSLNNFDDDAANPNQSSRKKVGFLTGIAASRVAADGPNQAQLQNSLNSPGAESGTTAMIADGAVVVAGSDINATANEDVEFDVLVGGIAGGLVGIGASVSVSSIAANTSAHVGGTLSAGDNINVIAILDDDVDINSYAGAIGFVGLGAAVGVVNDRTVVQAYIANSAIIVAADNLLIRALDDRNIKGNTGQISAGVVAAGASFVRVNIDNNNAVETTAFIGSNAKIGLGDGRVVNVKAEALPIHNGRATTLGLAGGIGAATINFATVNIASEAKATIANGTTVNVSGDVDLYAKTNHKGLAKGTGAAIGGLAIGAMIAETILGKGDGVDEVEAGLIGGVIIVAAAFRATAESKDEVVAESIAGAGGVVAGAGASSNTTNNLATNVVLGPSSAINVKTMALLTLHDQVVDSSADSVSIGLAAGTGAFADNEVTTKANIIISSGVVVVADNIDISANNLLSKERYQLNLDSATAGAVNVSILTSGTDIGTDAIPLQAVVSIAPGAKLTAVGSNANPNFFDIRTSTDFNAIDNVQIQGISLVGGVSVGLSRIEARTLAAIDANGAFLENKSGNINMTAVGGGDNLAGANLQVASGLTSVATANVTARTTATQRVNVTNATIKASDVSMRAGQDKIGTPNNFFTKGDAQILTASLLPNIATPIVHANLIENNIVNVGGTAKVLALEDVNLVAKEGPLGPNRAQADGGAVSLSLIPYGMGIVGGDSVSSSNQINIANTAKVEAGVGSTSIIQVRPVTFAGTPRLDPARLGTPLSVAEKQSLGIPVDMSYVYGTLSVDQIAFEIRSGHVMKLVSPTQGGVVGHYYKFLPQTTQTAESIIPHLEDFSNPGRWQDLGILTPQQIADLEAQAKPVYDSNVTLTFGAALNNKFYVVKPAEFESPRLLYRNVGNLLLEQRQRILGWIESHAGDSEAIARYQVQLELLDGTLNELGLLTPTGVNGVVAVKKELDTIFLNMPSIISSPGSIYIDAKGANPSTYSAMVGNQLIARTGARIDLLNRSPFTMNTSDILVKDNRRTAIDGNNNMVVLQPGNVYVNLGALTNVVDASARSINILQDSEGALSQFDLSGFPNTPSPLDQDLYINGDINNQAGNVNIENREGSIIVNGQINGATVNIKAAKDFTQNSKDWAHINRDPRQYLNYDTFRTQLFNQGEAIRASGNIAPLLKLEYGDTSFSDGTRTLNDAIFQDNGRVLAQGRIGITARFLNINGLIQSGVDSIQFSVASDFVPPAVTTSITSDNGTPLPGISFGVEGVPIDGQWDAGRRAFVLEKIEPQGGQIVLAGQILSTGNGRLKVASGYASVNIDNQSNYPVILDEIDTTKVREGKITIIDSGLLTKAEYAVVGNQVRETRFTGVEVPGDKVGDNIDNDGDGDTDDGQIRRIVYSPAAPILRNIGTTISYAPPVGTYYVWTEGQEKTQIDVRIYEKKSFNLFGDFLADELAADDSFASREVFFRDKQPLLESETKERAGTAGLPGYANGDAYTIAYDQRNDDTVELKPVLPWLDIRQARRPALSTAIRPPHPRPK